MDRVDREEPVEQVVPIPEEKSVAEEMVAEEEMAVGVARAEPAHQDKLPRCIKTEAPDSSRMISISTW